MNAKANQLARKLRKLGVKPDDFVAMLTERSLEMIIGIYGILKAGGAYVPMDPTYPEERIHYMLEDCKPKAVLTYHAEVSTNIPVIDLADSEVWTGATRNLTHINKSSDLAYCIYTSGTTGNPKGVMIEHHSLTNHLRVSSEVFFHNVPLTTAMFTNYCFDFSVPSIFVSTVNGGKIRVFENGNEALPIVFKIVK